METVTFFFDNIGAEDVKLFLFKRSSHTNHFFFPRLDFHCLAGSVQQAQQSNHLAEGLNPSRVQ